MPAHPIKIGERGMRYLTGRDGDAEIYDFVTDHLHGLPFQKAVDWYVGMEEFLTDEQRAYIACNDRFYLLVMLLGRVDMLNPWLYERVREVEAEPDGMLDLWARYHFKSSIITQGGAIQELCIDPEQTIAIFSENNEIARRFLGQIKQTLENNGLLKRVFNDVFWQEPKKNAPLWSAAKGLVVKRTGSPKEPSIGAYGLVNGMPTSVHFKILIYDDMLDQRSVTNEEMIAKVTRAYEMSTNLGVGEATRKQMVGTRYSFADTYGILIKRGVVTPRLYAATHNGQLDGKPVFLSPEGWEKVKREQRGTVAAQMLQNPLMGSENAFDVQWFRSWEIRPSILNVYIMCDPSRGRTKGSDRTAIAVIGIDTAGNKYFLDGYRHRMKLSDRWLALKSLHKKWTDAIGVQVVVVGYERFGQQADDEVFEEWMQRDNYYFSMEELAWPREGGQSKKHRVERLEPDFRNGRFWLPNLVWDKDRNATCFWEIKNSQIVTTPMEAPTRVAEAARAAGQSFRVAAPIRRKDEDGEIYDVTLALMEEMMLFPFGPKDDLVDATSRVYDIGAVRPRVLKVSAGGQDQDFVDA